MNTIDLKLECLRLAAQNQREKTATILAAARSYFAFITERQEDSTSPRPPFSDR